MATYKQVSYGSKGSDVTELQKLLNQNGYTLDTDGIYGSKTQAAVKDYQKKNNLAVDGIVGNNTWGALTKAPSNSDQPSPSTPAQTETKAPTFEYGACKPSDPVSQAVDLLQQQIEQKPGQYQSTWESQINDTLQQILNREKFSYDLNGDALYQQYSDQYVNQGKLASMDTMGQAAALTGGYGNSYAQSVGQQAYQAYLQQLNEVVPELYGMALDQHNQEGQALYDQAALMAQMEDQDYGRYRDQLSDYYAELERLTNDSRYQSETDYGRWADDRNFAYGQYADDRNFNYQTERDKIADEQWQKQYDEQVRQYNQSYALSASKRYSGTPTANPDPEPEPEHNPIEDKMYEYVKTMLNNVLEKGVSTQWNPVAAINANKDLTKEEKAVAIEIINEFISSGAMKSPGRIE
jgi:peptidoglycan hydrolase-like protein with peptidoglycan-binding domain